MKRYGPHGSFWSTHPTLTKMPITTFELWNEPYYNNGNNGDYNPGRYARLVKAAGAAGHAADPSAKFLLAADNQCALVSGTWVWWIDALYQAVPDLNNYFDGIAVHPYGSDLTNVQYPTPGQAYNGYSQVRRLETIRQQFVNHGASDKPLWLTEIGWPTCTNGGSDRCTTASGQATDIQTVFNYARSTWKPYVQAIFLYGYQDNNANTADPENDYGLVNHDGTPKPALKRVQGQYLIGVAGSVDRRPLRRRPFTLPSVNAGRLTAGRDRRPVGERPAGGHLDRRSVQKTSTRAFQHASRTRPVVPEATSVASTKYA